MIFNLQRSPKKTLKCCCFFKKGTSAEIVLVPRVSEVSECCLWMSDLDIPQCESVV